MYNCEQLCQLMVEREGEVTYHITFVRVALVAELWQARIEGDQGVLCAHVERRVYLPVHLADAARRVEKTLQDVVEDDTRTQGHTHGLDRVKNSADHVWARCKERSQWHAETSARRGTHSQRRWARSG